MLGIVQLARLNTLDNVAETNDFAKLKFAMYRMANNTPSIKKQKQLLSEELCILATRNRLFFKTKKTCSSKQRFIDESLIKVVLYP